MKLECGNTMKKFLQATVIALFFIRPISALAGDDEASQPRLREELLAMSKADQKDRMPANFNGAAVEKIDGENRKRLKEIVGQFGWPTISMVGKDGSFAAWLLVQHADADRPFQVQVLNMMSSLLKSKEIAPENYAYLYDRVNKPQRFGTQGECKAKGVWTPREIENESEVDQRRAAMGMQSLGEYIEKASRFLCVK